MMGRSCGATSFCVLSVAFPQAGDREESSLLFLLLLPSAVWKQG